VSVKIYNSLKVNKTQLTTNQLTLPPLLTQLTLPPLYPNNFLISLRNHSCLLSRYIRVWRSKNLLMIYLCSL